MRRQQLNNLERYVTLECDLTVRQNVIPAVNTLEHAFANEGIDIFQLFKIIGERQFRHTSVDDIELNKLAVIKTKAKISFHDEAGWKLDPLFNEYSKYKGNFSDGDCFPPIILTHPGVLRNYLGTFVPDVLYSVDGMHRIMSALEAGVKELDAYVIIQRHDLCGYIMKQDLDEIDRLGSECTWFPRYQEIREAGLSGQRVQEPRYTRIYDFRNLNGKTVVDFGGNIGQAAIEAYFNGASKIYNFDYQECVINTAKKISDVFGMNFINNTIDFNLPTFEEDVLSVVQEWDWTIYQAIYRTKEIYDSKKSFTFIVNKTKEGIYFEGNGDANIDTSQFYGDLFSHFDFIEAKYLGHSQLRPAYKILKA